MTVEIANQAPETKSENLADLSYAELVARSPLAVQFSMQIEVQSKTVVELTDELGNAYTEIAVDYVTVPRGKRKTKKTRLTFSDGPLLADNISSQPGVNYRVTLSRSPDPDSPSSHSTENRGPVIWTV